MNRRNFIKSTAPIIVAALTLSPIALLAAKKKEYSFRISVRNSVVTTWNYVYKGESVEEALTNALGGVDCSYPQWRKQLGNDLDFSVGFYVGKDRISKYVDPLFFRVNSKIALKNVCCNVARMNDHSSTLSFEEYRNKYLNMGEVKNVKLFRNLTTCETLPPRKFDLALADPSSRVLAFK